MHQSVRFASIALLTVGCGGATASSGNATGGATSSPTTGGYPAAGGSVSVGGAVANGGSLARGGSLQGGATATGGVAQGGIVSLGGTVGVGGSASSGICRSVADCQLSTDCCNCFAAGPGEATMVCKSLCTQTACQSAGIGVADLACIAGRCVLGRSCDVGNVACEMVEPTCPTGQVPSAIGLCYGPCIAISECSAVSSCAVCQSAGLACVTNEVLLGPSYHCASVPAGCVSNPTCACMNVCSPFLCAQPDSTNLYCYCPTC